MSQVVITPEAHRARSEQYRQDLADSVAWCAALKTCLKERGISQAEFARQVHYSVSFINQMLNGKVWVSPTIWSQGRFLMGKRPVDHVQPNTWYPTHSGAWCEGCPGEELL